MPVEVLGINHLGLAPKDVGKARWFFNEVLSLDNLGQELVKSQNTNTIMIGFSSLSSEQGPRLEILENETGTVGPIAKFLEKKGAGIHHVALAVRDVKAAIDHCVQAGVRMIDTAPRPGAHHTSIAFVHPESTGGILVELVEQL